MLYFKYIYEILCEQLYIYIIYIHTFDVPTSDHDMTSRKTWNYFKKTITDPAAHQSADNVALIALLQATTVTTDSYDKKSAMNIHEMAHH